MQLIGSGMGCAVGEMGQEDRRGASEGLEFHRTCLPLTLHFQENKNPAPSTWRLLGAVPDTQRHS